MKTWLLRPMPHNILRINEFINSNIIAIGWPDISSLQGKTKSEIHEALSHHPLNYDPQELGIATSTVNSFVNEMREGDFVVVPNKNDIYFAKITTDYFYDSTKKDLGYPHQRTVEWIKGPIRRDKIFDDLKKSLRAPRTIADLSAHTDTLLTFLSNSSSTTLTSVVEEDIYATFEYPIRLGLVATIKIPKDITPTEASRLGDFVKTLYFG